MDDPERLKLVTIQKFNEVDTNNNGYLDFQEFKQAFANMASEMDAEVPHDAQVLDLLREVDIDNDD